MDTRTENYIVSKFIELYFDREIYSFRGNPDKWPDSVIEVDDEKIALELTEILHKKDLLHANRRRLESNEERIENIIISKIQEHKCTWGGVIFINMDLESHKLNGKKLNYIGNTLGKLIIEKVRLDSASRMIKKFSFDYYFESSLVKIQCDVSPKFTQIVCNVGYKGMVLHNVSSTEIQQIIDRKNSPPEQRNSFDQSWLILVEDFNASMRNQIDVNSKFKTWYDQVFLFRLPNDEIQRLETY